MNESIDTVTDPMCACGHRKEQHGADPPYACTGDAGQGGCPCQAYHQTTEPD